MLTATNFTALNTTLPRPDKGRGKAPGWLTQRQQDVPARVDVRAVEALLRKFSGVLDVAVVERPGFAQGRRLVAYVVAEPGCEWTLASLRELLFSRVAIGLLPAAYVMLDALPRTPQGEVDRAALPSVDDDQLGSRRFEAPAGPVESAIAALWRELLGVAQLGRHDHFYELGGHSSLCVKMVHQLRQTLGVELGVKDVFENPTLRGFAGVVGERLHIARGCRATPLRAQGSLRPLFFVHSELGDIEYARALSLHLDPELPVYGLAPIGLAEDQPPLRSVEEMAAAYVSAMREVQPRGPYRVAGWSGGGMVAYEIANQLIGLDEPVEFLGLIDTPSAYPWPASALDADGVGRAVPSQRDEWLTSLAWLPACAPAQRLDVQEKAQRGGIEALLQAAQRHGLLPADASGPQLLRELTVQHAIRYALNHYARPPVPVTADLFISASNPGPAPVMGWDRVTNTPTRITVVPGAYRSLMQDGQIEGLASALSAQVQTAADAQAPTAELTYGPRVVIQSGRSAVRPLFCVPGAGASVTAFSGLANALSEDTPLHGFQPRGLCGTLVPHLDVPSAAQAYLKALRQEQPQGPYRLLGHSFGGWVAFEMACQLRAAGEGVDPLILLDSEAPVANMARFGRAAMLQKLASIYEMSLGRPLGVTEADFAMLDHHAQLALLHSKLVQAKFMPQRGGLEMLRGIVRVFATNLNTGYVPSQVFEGSLLLVTVADVGASEADSEATALAWEQAWAPFAASVRSWVAPGNHMSLLTPPHVGQLAAYLQPHLWATT